MKKGLLLFIGLLFYYQSIAQTKSINRDTIPYKFSLKKGWAIKVSPMALIEAEAKFGIEKELGKNSSIDIFASGFIPNTNAQLSTFMASQILTFDAKSEDYKFTLYEGKKIGIGYIRWLKKSKFDFWKTLFFYSNYTSGNSFKSDIINPMDKYTINSNKNHRKVICLQYLLGKSISTKTFFLDFYAGFGLRAIAVKSTIRKDSYNFSFLTTSTENKNWEKPFFLPSIQFGVDVGIH